MTTKVRLRKRQSRLTAELVRAIFSYDRDTGHLTWKVMLADKCSPGKRAGSVSNTGHRVVKALKETHCEHRIIWLLVTGEWPTKQIDHINRDPADNRWSNLREADYAEQSWNVGRNSRNTSGFKNVYQNKKNGRWIAKFMQRGRSAYVGTFGTPEEAARAVEVRATELRGEFDAR